MFDPRLPFTRAEARAAGLTDRQLAGPEFRRLFQGIYVSSKVADHPLVRAERLSWSIHPLPSERISLLRVCTARRCRMTRSST